MTDFDGYIHTKLVELGLLEIWTEVIAICNSVQLHLMRDDCLYNMVEVVQSMA